MNHQQPKDDEGTRRERERFEFSGLCHLVPLDEKGTRLRNKAIEIVGRDLSTSAIAFSHSLPLSNKRAVIILPGGHAGKCELEVEVVWTKRLSIGLYETGCKLVRKLGSESPA